MERLTTSTPLTDIDAATFDDMAQAPDNLDRRLELVAGAIIDMVSNQRSSYITWRVNIFLSQHIVQHNLGWMTGSDGGYVFGDERYIPDIAFVPFDRQAEPSTEAYASTPPALVVEVLSPANHKQPNIMFKKLHTYTRFGVVVWIVDPDAETVEVFAPNEAVRTYGKQDTLNGKPVLPDFTLPLSEIFTAAPQPPSEPTH